MNSSRKVEIEKLANKFRRTTGIYSKGISNIFDVCSSEYYLIRYPIGETAVLGAAMIKDGDIIIFSNSSYPLSREIFTVAHEIGHVVLNHIESNNCTIHELSSNHMDENELEANHFAVCLLMPKDKVDEYISDQFQYCEGYLWTPLEIATIMGTFNVSFDVALNRLNNLGYITNDQYEFLQHQKNETKVSNLLRAIGISPQLCFAEQIKRVPIDFLKWVKSNYQNGVIPSETMEKAVKYLDEVSIEDFAVTPIAEDNDFDLDAFLLEDDE